MLKLAIDAVFFYQGARSYEGQLNAGPKPLHSPLPLRSTAAWDLLDSSVQAARSQLSFNSINYLSLFLSPHQRRRLLGRRTPNP